MAIISLYKNTDSGGFGISRLKTKSPLMGGSKTIAYKEINGGISGAQTRDLQRDRAKFRVPDFG
jgi:hypothetical protein